MAEAENKALVRRFYDQVFNQGRIEFIRELLAPDFVEHDEFPGLVPTREGVEQMFGMLHAAFPDLHVVAENILAEGDKVAANGTMRGTHKGQFLHLAPTGREINVKFMGIMRFATGKMVEHWGVADQMAMMQQLGAIPQG